MLHRPYATGVAVLAALLLSASATAAAAPADATVPYPATDATEPTSPPPTDDSMLVKIDSIHSRTSGYQGIFIYGDTVYCSYQTNAVCVRSRVTGDSIRAFATRSGSAVISICRFGDSLCISRLSSPEMCEVYTLGGTYVRQFQPSGGQQVRGLDWDGTKFWASSYLSSAVTIYTMNASGTVLRTLSRSGGNPVSMSIARDLSLDRMYPNRLWTSPNTSSPYKVMYVAFDTSANTYTVLDTFRTGLSSYMSGIEFYSDPVIGGCIYVNTFSNPGWMYRFKVHEPMGAPGDVGTTRVVAPSGSIDYGDPVTPQAMVVNYGSEAQTFPVRFDIGTAYSDIQTVNNLPANDSVLVDFATWTVNAAGSHALKCSTQLYDDTVRSNDKATGSCFVRVFDVATTALVAPTDTVDSTAVITPACSVYNHGNTTVSYKVRLRIGSYTDSATVADHAPGTAQSVTFADWTVGVPRGTYAVSCSTELAPADTSRANDKQTGSVAVLVEDVALVEIAGPLGSYPEDTFVQPRGTWQNNGTQAATFETWALFDNAAGTRVYAEKLDMVGLIPGGTVQVGTFPACTLKTPGTWTVRCSTFLAGDLVPGNDFFDSTFTVTGVPHEGGWACKSAMPLSPSGKEPKDGAWLTQDGDYVYAAKGFKTGDFYSYDPVNDAWTQLLSWPAGREGKGPYKGSVGVAGGAGIYATKGNNTQGFWLYDIGANTWTQKADVPLGPTNKKVKGGTDLVYVNAGHGQNDTDYVYLLKGYKNEFWRYNTATDSWQQMRDAPAGVSSRWDKGSWLVGQKDPGQPPKPYTLFAHKAKFHEFWKYTTDGDTWFSTPLTGMPTSSYTGKNKKSKDGGSGTLLGDYIYALKGANTQEFWKYDVAGNAWTELETIPQVGTASIRRKKVKGGGDVVAAGDLVFAIKGNKASNIWQYTPSTFFYEPRPDRDGMMAEQVGIVAEGVTISPNPLASGHATLSYNLPRAGGATVSVFDAVGRCVFTRSFGARASSFALPRLGAGVYLVKLSADNFATTQKLVVQR